MQRQQAIAQMVSYEALRSRASGLKKALDALKEDINLWLTENPDEQLVDPATEISAFFKHVPGPQQLDVGALTGQTLIWAAAQGLLQGNMKAIAARGTSAPQLLEIHQHLSPSPGYTKLEVVPPTWQRRQELEASQPTAAPAQPPTPLRSPAATAAAPDILDPAEHLCPTHGRSRHSAKSGALFCPTKLDDDTWCNWTSERKAS